MSQVMHAITTQEKGSVKFVRFLVMEMFGSVFETIGSYMGNLFRENVTMFGIIIKMKIISRNICKIKVAGNNFIYLIIRVNSIQFLTRNTIYDRSDVKQYSYAKSQIVILMSITKHNTQIYNFKNQFHIMICTYNNHKNTTTFVKKKQLDPT